MDYLYSLCKKFIKTDDNESLETEKLVYENEVKTDLIDKINAENKEARLAEEAAALKKAEEEAAAAKKAEEEAAAAKKAEEEAAALKKAEEEAAALKKAEEEAAAVKKAEEEVRLAEEAEQYIKDEILQSENPVLETNKTQNIVNEILKELEQSNPDKDTEHEDLTSISEIKI